MSYNYYYNEFPLDCEQVKTFFQFIIVMDPETKIIIVNKCHKVNKIEKFIVCTVMDVKDFDKMVKVFEILKTGPIRRKKFLLNFNKNYAKKYQKTKTEKEFFDLMQKTINSFVKCDVSKNKKDLDNVVIPKNKETIISKNKEAIINKDIQKYITKEKTKCWIELNGETCDLKDCQFH